MQESSPDRVSRHSAVLESDDSYSFRRPQQLIWQLGIRPKCARGELECVIECARILFDPRRRKKSSSASSRLRETHIQNHKCDLWTTLGLLISKIDSVALRGARCIRKATTVTHFETRSGLDPLHSGAWCRRRCRIRDLEECSSVCSSVCAYPGPASS